MIARQEINQKETVAVVIATYNQASYLAQAIQSVVAQDHPVDEIIVSDDASTDETQAICEQLTREIPSLRYHRQARNIGIGGNVDFVLRQANSTYVLRLDSDDRLLPNCVSRLVDAMREAPAAAYGHGEVWEIDRGGNRNRLRTLYREPGFQTARDALIASAWGYRVAGNIVLFRREALVKVDYMKGRGDFAEDYHLAVALARAGYGNVYVAEPLAEYRVWLDGQGVRAGRKEQELRGLIRVFNEQIEPGFGEEGIALCRVQRARRSFALRHVTALENASNTRQERERLESCLIEMGDSLRLRMFIQLIEWRLGFLVRGIWALIDFSRSVAKKSLRKS